MRLLLTPVTIAQEALNLVSLTFPRGMSNIYNIFLHGASDLNSSARIKDYLLVRHFISSFQRLNQVAQMFPARLSNQYSVFLGGASDHTFSSGRN